MYGVRVCVWGVFPGLRLCLGILGFLVSTSCLRNRSQNDHCGINPAEAQTHAGSWTRETACNHNSHSYSDFVVSFRLTNHLFRSLLLISTFQSLWQNKLTRASASQHRAHSNPQSLTPLLVMSNALASGVHKCTRTTSAVVTHPSSLLRLLLNSQCKFVVKTTS